MNIKLIVMYVFFILVIIALAMGASIFITNPVYNNFIQYVLSGFVIFTIILVPFFIENHTKKYLETKGANLAKKEDLKELTTIVNEVKIKFETDSAILKSKLDIASGTALNLKNEERKATIELNESYFKWISMIRGDLIASSISDINNHDNDIKEAYNNMVYSETKFVLFTGNTELFTSYNNLKIASMKAYINKRLEITSKIKIALIPIEHVINEKDRIEEIRACSDETNINMRNFSEHIIAQTTIIYPIEREFQKCCREFIYSDS